MKKRKQGVFTGAYAVQPCQRKAYSNLGGGLRSHLLRDRSHYGMYHDERDHAFATKFGIDIIPVIQPEGVDVQEMAWTEDGVLMNSGPL